MAPALEKITNINSVERQPMERAIFSTGVRKYRIGTADQKVAAPPLFVLGRDVEDIIKLLTGGSPR